MMGRGTHAAVAALTLGLSMAAHAHSPHYGADDVATVNDTCAESPMTTSDYDTRHAWNALWDGDNYRYPFTLGPVEEGVTAWFGTASQSVFRSGRAHITIRLDDAHGWDRARTFKLMARSLASLPGPLVQRLPSPTMLDLTNYETSHPDGAAYAYAQCTHDNETGYDCTHGVGIPNSSFGLADDGTRPVPYDVFERLLIHEFAHVLDGVSSFVDFENAPECSGGCGWSFRDEWQAAIAESPCALSAYATTNELEDFAESLLWGGSDTTRDGKAAWNRRIARRCANDWGSGGP